MCHLVSSCLQRMIREIIPISGFTSGVGLLNGKLGIGVLLYHYSEYAQDSEIKDYAEYLTNETCESLAGAPRFDFDTGLIGVGWGINHLIAGRYVAGDSDEILEEIDHVIWDETGSCMANSFQMSGVGLYILSRKATGKDSALWDQRISAWIKVIDGITEQPEIIWQSRFLISVIYCLSVYRRLGLFIREIDKIWPKLVTHIEVVYRRTLCLSEKYILYNLCSRMEQSEDLSFFREPFPVSVWQPTLTDINRFYLYKLLCDQWQIQTPEVFRETINSIVSDRKQVEELLSLLNPGNIRLENHTTGFAWSLLQGDLESTPNGGMGTF